MENKVTVTGANKVFMLVLVINIVFSFVTELVDIAFGNILDDNMLLILMMIQFYCILFPALFYMIGNKINIKDTLRFNSPGLLPSFLIILISAPAFYAASALNSIVFYILQFIGRVPDDLPIPLPKNPGEVFVTLLVIAIAPAICEEILHRGLLLKAYENRGTMKAVVISGIMFGVFHFDITNLLGPILLGILFGYYVVRTNSIFAGVIAHFMNNFLATILQYLLKDMERDSSFYTLQDWGYTLLFGAICAVFVFLLLICFKFATEGKCRIKESRTTVLNDAISIISHWPIVVVIVLYIIFIGLYLITISL
ncbi:CPBP family intramembrane glutamic endopeptidase [Acetivibrio clariflavus]|uniref:CPBP family intramembrane glutamic endopeptidase n=1 Tax=Acetivibrio clariflavus TaxID=288965 RepID=UPI00047F8390|nr:type II CAAX endopeptidase family protein [Acetivibrio clariflavus]